MTYRIGCLSTRNEPSLGYWLRAIVSAGFRDPIIIFDEKLLSLRDLELWTDRTQERLPRIQLPGDAALYHTENHNSQQCVDLVRSLDLQVLANCGTPRILNARIINATPFGIINVHPGKLPAYRGCSCVEWAIYNDDPIFNTAHLMSEEIDEGPIVALKKVDIKAGDLYADIRVKTYQAAFALMPKAIKKVLEGAPTKIHTARSGKYWKPIDDDSLRVVMTKINNGGYHS